MHLVEDIVDIGQKVLYNKRQTLRLLQDMDKKLKDLQLAMKHGKTIGSVTTMTGTVMAFTPAAPIGASLLVGGTAISQGASVGGMAVAMLKAKEAEKILNSGKEDNEKLQNCLNILQAAVHKFEQETGEPTEVCGYTVLHTIIKQKVKAGGNVVGAAANIAKLAGNSGQTIGKLVDGDPVAALKSSGFLETALAGTLKDVLRIASSGVAVLGPCTDVLSMISGFKDDPTESEVGAAIGKLQGEVRQLEQVRNGFTGVMKLFENA